MRASPPPLPPARPPSKWFFVVALPLIWAGAATFGFRYPGDEYGMLAVGAIAGIWPFIFIPLPGTLDDVYPIVIGVGGLLVAILGGILDAAAVRRRTWFASWVVLTLVIVAWALSRYRDIPAAIAKNGTLAAYVFAAMNMSLYLTSALLIPAGLLLGWRRPGPSSRWQCPDCGYDLRGSPGPRCSECGAAMPRADS